MTTHTTVDIYERSLPYSMHHVIFRRSREATHVSIEDITIARRKSKKTLVVREHQIAGLILCWIEGGHVGNYTFESGSHEKFNGGSICVRSIILGAWLYYSRSTMTSEKGMELRPFSGVAQAHVVASCDNMR